MDRITIIARCIVLAASALCVAAYMQPAHAQGMRSATGTATSKYIAPTPQPYNSMARDTTPQGIENMRSWHCRSLGGSGVWVDWAASTLIRNTNGCEVVQAT